MAQSLHIFCQFCFSKFKTQRALHLHIAHTPACYNREAKRIEDAHAMFAEQRLFSDFMNAPTSVTPEDNENNDLDTTMQYPDASETELHEIPAANTVPTDQVSTPVNIPQSVHCENSKFDAGGMPTTPFIREFEEQDGLRPGHVYGYQPTPFEREKNQREAEHISNFAPFSSRDEWELAQWLIKSELSQSSIDEFLKLRIVSDNKFISNKCARHLR